MAEEERSPLQPQIEQALRDLASNSAAKRRAAAYFLGEAAQGDAVPTLIEMYKNDKNPGVRRAAAYALGQFRAVDEALGKGEQAKVTALLRAVEVEGQLGKRAPTASRVRLLFALVVSLALIGVLFLFRNNLAGAVLGGKTDRTALLRDVRSAYDRVSADTRTLQTEYLNVISNIPLSCVAFFNAPPPYVLDNRDAAAYADIAAVVRNINSVRETAESARVAYDQACAGPPENFTSQQANDAYRTLVPALPLLAEIELQLTAAEANTTPPTLAPTATIPPPTAEPTIAPTAVPPTAAISTDAAAPDATAGSSAAPTTVPVVNFDLDRALPMLYGVIDDANGARGAATMLVQYWEEVGNTGNTGGCSIRTPPNIPTHDIVVPESEDQKMLILRRAVDLIDNGITALQSGWTDFIFACNSQNLMGSLPGNIANARAAQSAFANAATFLDQVRELDAAEGT